ncbi:helix-turn-helix transcriptional regulator [Dactylosporangium matsuzakiense]|uniref:LuxR family transcriptional regulator n=2 Tax=Dactylosporangium matsuzakiense TaxID=53360 RepID=A0A9W6KSH8_9ACTN|nr:LuxR family transcriptional regulator [Dactylosporangium matsuzakiense]
MTQPPFAAKHTTMADSVRDGAPDEAIIDGAVIDDHVAAAYNLLLEQPGLDLQQFAERLSCTEAAVRAILNRLTDLALLNHTQSEHGGLVAVSPLAAMQSLLAREQAALNQRQEFLQQSADTFSSILSAYGGMTGRGDSDRLAQQLTDLPTVRLRLQELAMSAKEEVLSFSPGPRNPSATRAASRPLDLSALSRGVRMKTIYLDTIAFDPEGLKYAQEMVKAGAEIRTCAALPMRMIVIDSATAVLPRSPDNDTDGAVIIRQESMVAALVALFESHWNQGRALPEPDAEPTGWNASERAVLRLLATGAKDDAVARQLGTSVRTVRRTIGVMMTRAGASSRFTFGVYAALQDWL